MERKNGEKERMINIMINLGIDGERERIKKRTQIEVRERMRVNNEYNDSLLDRQDKTKPNKKKKKNRDRS